MPNSRPSWSPAVPPPPVSGAAGYWVAEGTAVGVVDADGRWVADVTCAVGVAAWVAVAVWVDVAVWVAVAVWVDVALAVADAFGVDVGLSVGVAAWVADALPVAVVCPTCGVFVALPVPVVEVGGVGCGVKTDGTDEAVPPPLQAATVTVMSTAPAATRAPMSQAPRFATGRMATGRMVTGWVVTGMVRRTFMKPPRTRGGRWRRVSLADTVYSSICHRGRLRKSERAGSR